MCCLDRFFLGHAHVIFVPYMLWRFTFFIPLAIALGYILESDPAQILKLKGILAEKLIVL